MPQRCGPGARRQPSLRRLSRNRLLVKWTLGQSSVPCALPPTTVSQRSVRATRNRTSEWRTASSWRALASEPSAPQGLQLYRRRGGQGGDKGCSALSRPAPFYGSRSLPAHAECLVGDNILPPRFILLTTTCLL